MVSNISISLPESLTQAIDSKRKLVSRSKFISNLLQARIACEAKTTDVKGGTDN
jgi:metal-responsive CopG/Arc/MetJ family transcriptional regulator